MRWRLVHRPRPHWGRLRRSPDPLIVRGSAISALAFGCLRHAPCSSPTYCIFRPGSIILRPGYALVTMKVWRRHWSYFLSFAAKMYMDLAFTNSGDREFQMLTILLEKKFNCQLLLQIGLIRFLCPLVTEVWGANLKKASTSKSQKPLIMQWISAQILCQSFKNAMNIHEFIFGRDHSGGNREWKKRYPNIPIYGGSTESIPGKTQWEICIHILLFSPSHPQVERLCPKSLNFSHSFAKLLRSILFSPNREYN